jgi:hypothetical protein
MSGLQYVMYMLDSTGYYYNTMCMHDRIAENTFICKDLKVLMIVDEGWGSARGLADPQSTRAGNRAGSRLADRVATALPDLL